MKRAVEKVQVQLEKTVRTLEANGIPYCIIGANAVRAWVAQKDEAAVRTMRDVDILLRRRDLPVAIAAMQGVGFDYRHSAGICMSLDHHDSKARDAVHILLACERVRETDLLTARNVEDSAIVDSHRTLSLAALVRMKLSDFRDKDRVHLRDMVDVELINSSWVHHVPPELAAQLQELLDNPA